MKNEKPKTSNDAQQTSPAGCSLVLACNKSEKEERKVCDVCGHSNPESAALCEMCSNYLFD